MTTPNSSILSFDSGEEHKTSPALSAYQAWKESPGKQTMGQLLKTMDRDIDQGLAAHLGPDASKDPVLRGRARLMVAQSIPRYDPQQAGLRTFVRQQLQGMKRHTAQVANPVSVPERVSLDRQHMQEVEQAFEAENGRLPSTAELADRSRLSRKRIQYVRRFQPGVSEGSFSSILDSDSDDAIDMLPAIKHDRDTALAVIYDDLGPIDKTIMEHSLGMYGAPILANQDLAKRLRMTPSAISQRKAKLQALLDEAAELFP